ncbi:MAG TPA: type IVB secretion system protein IcmH/DotU [Planctomycetota bacterium]
MPDSPAPTTIPDLAADLLAYTLQLRKLKDPGPAETLRQRVDDQFRALESRARQGGIPLEDVQLIKYAMAAFIDESVLTSQWPAKDVWSGKPLQLEYFNDFSAGEEFYVKLEAVRAGANPRKAEILEVFYSCLALGFRGKYVDLQGMERKKVLMDTLAREIKAAKTGATAGLSPSWKPPEEKGALVQSIPAWLVPALGGVVVLLLFIVMAFLLGWTAGDVLKVLGG